MPEATIAALHKARAEMDARFARREFHAPDGDASLIVVIAISVVLGVLLVIFVLLVPKGLTALVADAWRWLASLATRPHAAAEPAVRERTSNP